MVRGEYDAWTHEELERALRQAEDDIRDLKTDLESAMEDRDRYYRESRDSARTLGGILKVMGENGMFLEGLGPIIREGLLPDDAPALREAASRPRRFTRNAVQVQQVHRYAGTPDGITELCSCGAQWLLQAERCVVGGSGR